MYKQTDPVIAIYAWAEDERTHEYGEWNVMKKWGCLFASLLYLCELATGRLFSPEQVLFLYKALVALKVLRKDMYVLNHEEVIRAGLQVLGYSVIEVRYHGKFQPRERVSGRYQLEQVRTPLGNGHFRHPEWDPYNPPIESQGLISNRGYDIRVRGVS